MKIVTAPLMSDIEPLLETAFEAGKAILEIYHQDMVIQTKADASPVTAADQAAEDIILGRLQHIAPGIPIIAEESASRGDIPQACSSFFLVDPLDGTKEFINRRDEFTVNIALIESGIPILGVVYAPALKAIYYSTSASSAFHAVLDCEEKDFHLENRQILKTRIAPDIGNTVVTSRSHLNQETEDFLENYKVANTACAGSSLKFCLLASGQADLYPRLARTMEWDTAAGQAVLMASGGCVLTEDGQPLRYGKVGMDYANPGFIAWGKRPG